MDGATFDAVYGLEEAGFRVGRAKRTGELTQLVVYECRPDWPCPTTDEVVRRLEQALLDRGAFKHEARAVTTLEEVVALNFVTWWDSGKLYTGRIEVKLR